MKMDMATYTNPALKDSVTTSIHCPIITNFVCIYLHIYSKSNAKLQHDTRCNDFKVLLL